MGFNIKDELTPKNMFWGTIALGGGTLAVKGAKDLYNWSKKRLGEWWDKKNETKKQEELQKLRPWDYFTPPQKGVTGSNLQVAHKVPLWGYAIYEGWNYTLFAPTNVGKTTFAQQILCELAYADTSAIIPGMEIGYYFRFTRVYAPRHYNRHLRFKNLPYIHSKFVVPVCVFCCFHITLCVFLLQYSRSYP